MKDLKFEQKRSLSRAEAADQLAALARALRVGGEAEVELGGGVLSLRVPDELRTEVEIEVDGNEIELEIELKWTTGPPRKGTTSAKDTSSAPDAAKPAQPAPAKPARPARPARSRKTAATKTGTGAKTGTATARAKRPAAKRA